MSAVDEWLAQRRPGWSLPQPLYLSPEVFDRDIERIFMRSWTFVGHVARIPVTGDYFLYEFGDESVVVIRTDEQAEDGAGVAAFFNVCRHRGSRVCLEDEGRAKGRLVCPYHAWTYSLDGQWASARHMPDSFDGRGMDLHRYEVCVVEGLIFVCPAPRRRMSLGCGSTLAPPLRRTASPTRRLRTAPRTGFGPTGRFSPRTSGSVTTARIPTRSSVR